MMRFSSTTVGRERLLLAGLVGLSVWALRKILKTRHKMVHYSWNYDRIRTILEESGISFPLVLVDLPVFDDNIKNMVSIAASHNKQIRVVTKSLRVTELISRVLKVGGETCVGCMCFSVPEANHIFTALGVTDLIVAYPCVHASDLEAAWAMLQKGAKVVLMVDEAAHVHLLDAFVRNKLDQDNDHLTCRAFDVCIDLDVSYRPFGIHLGAHRSPVRSPRVFQELAEAVLAAPTLQLVGVMAYEAQVAGVPDAWPHSLPLYNTALRLLQGLSRRDVARKRASAARYLAEKGVRLRFFNGGGSGSVHSTASEECVTEVAVGSGFLQSQMFDYFSGNMNEPALAFALQVTRICQSGTATCHSGGFIASGAPSALCAPTVFLPAGVQPFPSEGFGEVQTPLQMPSGFQLKLGDPVLCRPAKAGEFAEHFSHYYLLSESGELTATPTYRGQSCCFH